MHSTTVSPMQRSKYWRKASIFRNQGGVCIGRPCGLRFKDSRGTLTLVIYLRQTLCVVPGCHCPSRFTSSSVLSIAPYPRTNVGYVLQYRFITLELMSTGEKILPILWKQTVSIMERVAERETRRRTKPTSQPATESMLSSSIIESYKTLQAPEMQRLKPGFLLLLGTVVRDVISHFPTGRGS